MVEYEIMWCYCICFLTFVAAEVPITSWIGNACEIVWQNSVPKAILDLVMSKTSNPNSGEECEMPNQSCKIERKEQCHPISYISKIEFDYGLKLVIRYINDKNEVEKYEATDSSCPIEIPKNTKNIEVRFQVMRSIFKI